jgi:dTDP-4-dehydrorhamnose 3,5-epimerase
MIDGVLFKELVTHGDERGFLRELIRVSDEFFADGFGQLSHSLVQQNVLKAWHGHVRQAQWTHVIAGVLDIAVHDARPASVTFGKTMTFLLGDGHPARIYRLPPGVLHGYRCIAGPAHVLYVTSGVYDVIDEVRVAHDDPGIGYCWGDAVVVSANP